MPDTDFVCTVTSQESLSQKLCAVCGKKAGILSRFKLADGYICNKCLLEINQGIGRNAIEMFANLNIASIPEFAKQIKDEKEAIENELKVFNATQIGNRRILIDDQHKLVKIAHECKTFTRYHEEDYQIFRFDQIASYNLFEEGKNENICKSLTIRIAIKNSVNSSFVMDFITSETKKDSIVYRTHSAEAQKCVSDLEVILSSISADTIAKKDVTVELRKYKALVDDNIITQEEFEKKKKQLLSL